MADRGSTSGKLPTSTMSTGKRMKQGSDTKRGFTRISIGDQIDRWMAIFVTQCYVVFTVRGETYSVPDGPTHMFSKIHIGVTVYLFNIFSPGSSSYGYLKDII